MKRIITGSILMLAAAFVTTATAQEVEVHEEEGKKECIIRMNSCGGGSFLGVHLDEVTNETAQELGLREESGAHLTKIVEDSPAAKAGLQADDVVTGWNGERVESSAQLQRLVRETPSGRSVDLTVIRNGREMNINAELGSRSMQWNSANTFKFYGGDMEMPEMPEIEAFIEMGEMPELAELSAKLSKLHNMKGAHGYMAMFSSSGGRLGVTVQNLSPQLGKYFGVSEDAGVLISDVGEETAAEKAGLQAGDIIMSVDGEEVTDPHSLKMIILAHKAGSVELQIIRDKREQTITAELGEMPKSMRFFKNEDGEFNFDSSDDFNWKEWGESEEEVIIDEGSDLE